VAEQKKDVKEQCATREDVRRAAESLSPTDAKRLERFAVYRVRGLGRKAMSRDHEDLLREAITSTWIGAEDTSHGRSWRKAEVSFVQHLLGAMRSIASHWKEAFDENEAYLDSEMTIETEEGETRGPIQSAPSGEPSQERVLIAKEELRAISLLFETDIEAALIIEEIKEGWSGPETMRRLGMTRNQYEAAVRRIRYHVK